MKNRKLKYLILMLFLAVSVILAMIAMNSNENGLEVVFFDVGQGDSILIQKGDRQILIDGGPSGKVILEKLGKYMPFWDRKIDIIIATHPDQDHIGGLPEVIKNYEIGAVIEPDAKSDSKTYEAYEKVIGDMGIKKYTANYGMEVKLSADISLDILNPGGATGNCGTDTNSQSVVSKLVHGKSSFLFIGDLPGDCEKVLSETDIDIDSDIFKVAHHGSKNSSTAEFLAKVSPEEAIISVGKDNRYGHPNMEALDRLKTAGAKILRTDEMSDIVYICWNADEKCELSSK